MSLVSSLICMITNICMHQQHNDKSVKRFAPVDTTRLSPHNHAAVFTFWQWEHHIYRRGGVVRTDAGWCETKAERTGSSLGKTKKKGKTKRHSGVVMVGCALSSRLCVHASGEDGTKKVWDSEQQGVGVCPGWRHFWVGFRCRTFPEQERSTERTRCFKSDTLWASCTPLIRTGKRLFSLLRNTI